MPVFIIFILKFLLFRSLLAQVLQLDFIITSIRFHSLILNIVEVGILGVCCLSVQLIGDLGFISMGSKGGYFL